MSIDEVDAQFATRFAEQFADTWRSPDLAKHEALWSDDIVLDPADDGHPARQAGLPGVVSAAVRADTRSARRRASRRPRHPRGVHRVHVERNLLAASRSRGTRVDRFTFTNGLIADGCRTSTRSPLIGKLVGRPAGWERAGPPSVRSCSSADRSRRADRGQCGAHPRGNEPPWTSQSSGRSGSTAIASAPSSRGRGSSAGELGRSEVPTRSAIAAS